MAGMTDDELRTEVAYFLGYPAAGWTAEQLADIDRCIELGKAQFSGAFNQAAAMGQYLRLQHQRKLPEMMQFLSPSNDDNH